MVARLRFHRQRCRRRALAAAPRVPKRCRPAWSYQARRRQRRRVLRCRQASEAAADKALSRAQALQALACPSAEVRRAGTERLGEIGKMADADNLLARGSRRSPQAQQEPLRRPFGLWANALESGRLRSRTHVFRTCAQSQPGPSICCGHDTGAAATSARQTTQHDLRRRRWHGRVVRPADAGDRRHFTPAALSNGHALSNWHLLSFCSASGDAGR